ncbi:hypothetical protein PHJA_001032000 [Phtheirospermum japonicum]|uniref:Uncharacterized protein n=1 Tax=Phtheirospermum japonicum TaxID=374723 RepID=A0A830BYI2_9LAMI|nr:hypothetical protein PHJA_001032000 [Phtheirospermum japonicum]
MGDQETWHSLSHDNNACWPRSYSSRKYDRFVSYSNVPMRRPKAPIWTQLWRKLIKREKKSIFHCSKSMRFTYDEYSYSQNFDQGLVWADPDDLSRSFSARFAVPSRIFENHRLMV